MPKVISQTLPLVMMRPTMKVVPKLSPMEGRKEELKRGKTRLRQLPTYPPSFDPRYAERPPPAQYSHPLSPPWCWIDWEAPNQQGSTATLLLHVFMRTDEFNFTRLSQASANSSTAATNRSMKSGCGRRLVADQRCHFNAEQMATLLQHYQEETSWSSSLLTQEKAGTRW